jgi:outer membrane protein assembly factor BamB
MKVERVAFVVLAASACGGHVAQAVDEGMDASPGPTSDAMWSPTSDAASPRDAGTPADQDVTQGVDGGALPPGSWEPPDPSTAPSILVNAAHTGTVVDATLRPPLAPLWSVPLGPKDFGNQAYISYPLIVHGLVYALFTSTTSSSLVALDAHTGNVQWGPVDAGGGFAHAYDAGRIFVINSESELRAFDAATGSLDWVVTLFGAFPSFSAAPTAYRGIVYVSGGGDLGGYVYAVDEGSGSLLWKEAVDFGDDSAPTVSDDGVFVSYACVQAYAFNRLTGAPLWHHDGPCGGGGGETTVLYNRTVYAMDPAGNLKLDEATGNASGSFAAVNAPSFDASLGFFITMPLTINAIDLATGQTAWTFAGDESIDCPVVLAGGTAYAGSLGGMLYALDEQSGQLLWSTNTGAPIRCDLNNLGLPMNAMAAAEGILVAPAGGSLVAYSSASSVDAGVDGQ